MAKKKKTEKPIKLENSFIPSKFVYLIFALLVLILFFEALYKPSAAPDVISQWYPSHKHNIEYFLKNFKFPLWRNYINGGIPELDPDFQYSFTQIITLGVFGNIKTAVGITYFLTVLLAGIFAFIYFGTLTKNKFTAFIGALIYMFSGDMISIFNAGHFGKTMVMALIPITLYFTDRGFKSGKIINFLITGALLGISYPRHPQIFYYFMLFFGCYYIFKIILLYLEKRKFKIILKGALWFGIIGITAIVLALPSLYHQMSYQKLTSRGMLQNENAMWNFATSWSHHPAELIGFFIPSVFGIAKSSYLGWKPFDQSTNYMGIIPIILVIIGIFARWEKKSVKFNSIILVLMILFSFGRHFPSYYKFFYHIVPLIKKFRVPVSIFLVATFIMVYLAFQGLKAILNAKNDKKIKKRIQIALMALLIFIVIISIWINTDSYTGLLRKNIAPENKSSNNQLKGSVAQIVNQYGYQGEQHINKNIIGKEADIARTDTLRMWLWIIIFLISIFLFLTNRIKQKSFMVVISLIIFLDLFIIGKRFIVTTDNYNQIDKETTAIKYLKKDNDKFRILPILSHNESNKWGLFGLESATGYFAAGLKVYEDISKSGLLNNFDFLGLFNVKYLVTQRQYNIPDVELVNQGYDNRFVYKNKKFLPRFFLSDQYEVIDSPEMVIENLKLSLPDNQKKLFLEEKPDIGENVTLSVSGNNVEMSKWDITEIVFNCKVENHCFLFLSEIFYPKWKAYVDKEELKVYKTDYMFRSVLLQPGEYILKFKFHNNGSYLITIMLHYILSLITSIMIVILLMKRDDSNTQLDTSEE